MSGELRSVSVTGDSFADLLRIKSAISLVLSVMREYTRMFGGNPTRAVVLLTATYASTRSISRPVRATPDGFVVNEQRRPASVAELARLAGLPPETVRRHVRYLEREKLLTRTSDGGVLVLAENLMRAEIAQAFEVGRSALADHIAAMRNPL